jgi:hypothetical protein
LLDKNRDQKQLGIAIEAIRAKRALNAQQEIQRINNIEALMHFIAASEQLRLPGVHWKLAPRNPPYLRVGGVDISVQPELELQVAGSQDRMQYGYLRIYTGKGHALTEETGKHAAAIVHQFAQQQQTEWQEPQRQLCLVFDVFRKTLYRAPVAFRNRRAQIEEACFEIAARWSTI